jgi:hypothetical protein
MSVNYPFSGPFVPNQFEWGGTANSLATTSVLNRGVQTSSTPGKRWMVGMVLPIVTDPSRRAQVEAYFDALNGQEGRVNIYHYGRVGRTGVKGTPMGTINTAGVTVLASLAQFAPAVTLTGCGPGNTLQAGDLFNINGQLIMSPSTLTADGSGNIAVPVTDSLRLAVTAGQAVTLYQPTAQFVMATPDWRAVYQPGMSPAFAIDFIEVF